MRQAEGYWSTNEFSPLTWDKVLELYSRKVIFLKSRPLLLRRFWQSIRVVTPRAKKESLWYLHMETRDLSGQKVIEDSCRESPWKCGGFQGAYHSHATLHPVSM